MKKEHQELDSAKRSVRNMEHALVNRNEHLTDFAQMVSHNLRSPIAGIKMLLSLYDMKEGQEEREDLINHLKEGAAELFDMVEDLSNAMLDYTQLNNKTEDVVLDEVLHEAKAALSDEVKQSGIEIKADFKVIEVHYIRDYLDSIFQELIRNAIKYPHPERSLKLMIKSYLQDDKLMLSFTDNGLGIDVQRYDRQLFKMYKTFHPETGKDGKGIGLFLIKNKVEMMGGKVNMEGSPQEGTTLYLELYRV